MEVAISGDRLDRTIAVERACDENEEFRITLGITGEEGEAWVWLSDDEATTIATALLNECREGASNVHP